MARHRVPPNCGSQSLLICWTPHREVIIYTVRFRAWGFPALLATACVVVAVIVPLPMDEASAQTSWSDIDDAGIHADSVRQLSEWSILDGTHCDVRGQRFCPDEPILRWMMAVWLVRLLDNVAEPFPDTDGSVFSDIHADGGSPMWWSPHVDRLRTLGITEGCAATRFCPYEPVTRSQMATFLTRAFDLEDPENAPSAGFEDVVGGAHEAAINALARAEITGGCETDPPRFCPQEATTKAQMASFLDRAVANSPLPVITSSSSRITEGPIEVLVSFGRPVRGFTIDDVWVVNGEVSEPVPVGDAYRVTVSPRKLGGTAIVRVRKAAVHDAAGRANRASEPFARVFDCPPSDCESLIRLKWNPEVGIDTWDREGVVRAYREEYSGESPYASWTGGSTETCDPGTTSQAYRDSVISRLNYYRAMAGVLPVTENAEESSLAQLKVLILFANGRVRHYVDEDWICYTPRVQDQGRESLSPNGRDRRVIDAFIEDWGPNNRSVGHRNHLLDRHATEFGIGAAHGVNWRHTTIVSISDAPDSPVVWDERELGFTAWPPPGYVPSRIVFPRWNLVDSFRSQSQEGGPLIPSLTSFQVLDDRGEQVFTWRFGEHGYRLSFRFVWNMDDPADNILESAVLHRPIKDPLYRDACYTVIAEYSSVEDRIGSVVVASVGGTIEYVTCLIPYRHTLQLTSPG